MLHPPNLSFFSKPQLDIGSIKIICAEIVLESMVYWKEGKRLNNSKYIVNKILGSGGFGVTYKITEAKTNRLFALKP